MPASSASQLLANVERLMLLRTFTGFATISPAEISVLAEHTRKRFFRAGSVIAREGEPPTSIHFIVDGEVELSRHGHTLEVFGPRSAVGGLNYLARDPDTPQIVALEDTVTLEILSEDMEDVFEDNFGILVNVTRAVARGIMQLRRELGTDAGYRQDGESVACPARALDLVERIFFLRKSITFAGTRIEALAQLARHAEEVRLAEGAQLWDEGDESDRLLFIICGSIECTTADGKQFEFRGGGSVGGLDLLADEPRWYSARVAEGLVALQFDREIFLDVLEDHYEMARDFIGVLAAGLLGLMEQRAGHDGHDDHDLEDDG